MLSFGLFTLASHKLTPVRRLAVFTLPLPRGFGLADDDAL